jgi:hypothetical protein
MKQKYTRILLSSVVLTSSIVTAADLYQADPEADASIPLKWSVGLDAVWDDNTNPGGATDGDETFALSPFAGLSYASVDPQTTIALYARLGMIYYIDEPESPTSDDSYINSRMGFDLSHRFDERLRYSSRNTLSYELEPDYSQGVTTSRQSGEYLYYTTDNSLGYRWSERFGTYTGITLTGVAYDDSVANSDRDSWTAYNQLRYQLSEQTVLTNSYRFSQSAGSGQASDSQDQYLIFGAEHRISATSTIVGGAGLQFREVDNTASDTNTNPYVEFSMNTQANEAFTYSLFVRYGAEDYDTLVGVPGVVPLSEFENKMTLRLGVTTQYRVSPTLLFFGGLNVINSSFEEGRTADNLFTPVADQDETLINASIGSAYNFTDSLIGTLTYNFTDSDSDLVDRSYDRSTITAGLRLEF